MTTADPNFRTKVTARVIRVKSEVLSDIRRGVVPTSVSSFADLHDHVDANGYGGAFEEGEWDADGDDAPAVERLYVLWNAVQSEIHSWLATGGHREESTR